MAFLFSQKRHDALFGGAKLIAIYHYTNLYTLVGILVAYACNQTC